MRDHRNEGPQSALKLRVQEGDLDENGVLKDDEAEERVRAKVNELASHRQQKQDHKIVRKATGNDRKGGLMMQLEVQDADEEGGVKIVSGGDAMGEVMADHSVTKYVTSLGSTLEKIKGWFNLRTTKGRAAVREGISNSDNWTKEASETTAAEFLREISRQRGVIAEKEGALEKIDEIGKIPIMPWEVKAFAKQCNEATREGKGAEYYVHQAMKIRNYEYSEQEKGEARKNGEEIPTFTNIQKTLIDIDCDLMQTCIAVGNGEGEREK